MKKTVTIEVEVPDGKKAVLKDNKIVFEDIELPKTWEEYCERTMIDENEVVIDNHLDVPTVIQKGFIREPRNPFKHKRLLPSEEVARQFVALIQLYRLRDCYRQGWKPDLTVPTSMFAIFYIKGKYSVDEFISSSEFLSFQSKEIACKFLFNFHDLIEQAGDLI